MTDQGGDSERPSAGMRILKWLAPLTSGAALVYLVARVSSCNDDPTRDTVPPLVAEPAPQAPAQEPAAQPEPTALPEGTLGGSKSGIIGILKAQERAAEAVNDPSSLHFLGTSKAPPHVISDAVQAPEQPAQAAPAKNKKKLLGGTKSFGIELHPDVEEPAHE